MKKEELIDIEGDRALIKSIETQCSITPASARISKNFIQVDNLNLVKHIVIATKTMKINKLKKGDVMDENGAVFNHWFISPPFSSEKREIKISPELKEKTYKFYGIESSTQNRDSWLFERQPQIFRFTFGSAERSNFSVRMIPPDVITVEDDPPIHKPGKRGPVKRPILLTKKTPDEGGGGGGGSGGGAKRRRVSGNHQKETHDEGGSGNEGAKRRQVSGNHQKETPRARSNSNAVSSSLSPQCD
jgi:hypothetical protein